MIRKLSWCLSVLLLLFLFASLPDCPAALDTPACLTLGGQPGLDPLAVEILDNGNMGVSVWDEIIPGTGRYGYVARIFDQVCWSSVLHVTVGSQSRVYYGDAVQDCAFPGDTTAGFPAATLSAAADGISVTAEWLLDADLGLTLRQEIRYSPGSYLVHKQYQVLCTATELTDLILIHGGDVTLHDEGLFSQAPDRTIRVTDRGLPPRRQVHYAAASGTPWNLWLADRRSNAWRRLEQNSLGQTVAGLVTDAAVLVGWQHASLSAQTAWVLATTEDYSPPAIPTPSPSPVPTVTPTPSPIPTSTPTPTPSPIPTASPTPMPSPSPSPIPSSTPTPTSTPSPSPSPVPPATPTPLPSATPPAAPAASPLPTVAPT
ncbi:MAG: hypothetical protein GX112_11070, partial [Clostridiaceae bacterium]|nr:hypothetical protein [Clostridiaceae bacterium]